MAATGILSRRLVQAARAAEVLGEEDGRGGGGGGTHEAEEEEEEETTTTRTAAKRRRTDGLDPEAAGAPGPASTTAAAGHGSATNARVDRPDVEAQALRRAAAAFRGKQDVDVVSEVGIRVTGAPFPACTLHGVFEPAFLNRVKEEFLSLQFNLKSNDLYHFYQTKDLISATSPALRELREVLYSEAFVRLIGTIAGVTLNRNMDMSGHRYPPAGYLLCHDDELEGRRIAYILYLVPEDWSMEDGGRLELFAKDANGQPAEVVQRIVPQWNSMAFFEVTPESYHQVSEVLSAHRDRHSISGWFYSDDHLTRPPPFLEPAPAATPIAPTGATTLADVLGALGAWVRPEYLDATARKHLRETFIRESSFRLVQFLRADRYDAVVAALHALPSAAWSVRGPANRRHYERPVGPLPAVVSELLAFLTSTPFALYLSEIVALTPESVTAELSRWRHGAYTLVHDDAVEPPGLDVVLSIVPSGDAAWPADAGGETVYVSEDDVLLTSEPASNVLEVVLRDEGVLRFVRFVNARADDRARWDVSLVFQAH